MHRMGENMRTYVLLLLFFGGCESTEPEAIPPEECGNRIDDDQDGLIDCLDLDCLGDTSCPEACGDSIDNDGDGLIDCLDLDCDGSCMEVCDDGRDNDGDDLIDCLDADCLRNPICPELCDDNQDNDGDGFTDCADEDCAGPECRESCGDGIDNDGDGIIDCDDEDCDGNCLEICDDGRDNDGDSMVDCADLDCNGECPEDCGDRIDNDGDGMVDCDDTECDVLCDTDSDGVDDFAYGGTDCDDEDPDVYPGADEICDEKDNDCDLLVDDADDSMDPLDWFAWYTDADGDGYGDPDEILGFGCQPVEPGASSSGTDCDDDDETRSPGEPERCDSVDNDCDGLVDDEDPDLEPDSALAWYEDEDGDGFGNPFEVLYTCDEDVDGYVENGDDCDDDDATFTLPEYWVLDADGDGYGVGGTTDLGCSPPGPGYARMSQGEDCDETDDTIHPGAPDECGDGFDTNCDGEDDLTWWEDVDGDGYGNPDAPLVDCSSIPAGHVDNSGDCDDTDPDIRPGAIEVCNGLDDNCDDVISPDEVDSDGDGASPCEGDPDDSDPYIYAPPCEHLEDFEGGVWTAPGWDLVSSGGTISTEAYEGSYSVEDPGWHWHTEYVWGEPGAVLEAAIYAGGLGRAYLGFSANDDGCRSFVVAPNTGDIRFQQNDGYGYAELTTESYSFALDQWYWVQIENIDGYTMEGRVYASDRVTLLTSVSHTYDTEIEPGGVAMRGFSNFNFDAIQVCYY
jgi:hypothetical protein